MSKKLRSQTMTLIATPDESPEYDYKKRRSFFEYAYLEHVLQNNQLNISELKDLYDAGYTSHLINARLGKIREKAKQAPKPIETNIIIMDVINEGDLSSLGDAMEGNADDLINNKISQLVILSIIIIDHHALTLAIHIAREEAHFIFSDPYGENNASEEKSTVLFGSFINLIETIFIGKIKKYYNKSAFYDLQGFYYDNSNCAVLSLYAIEKFLTLCLCDTPPSHYEIRLSFDQFPDQALNKSLHDAFVLRLKVYDILSINENHKNFFGFQNVASKNYVDLERQRNALIIVHDLAEKIHGKAIEKYRDFTPKLTATVSRLSPEQVIELLNTISEDVVSNHATYVVTPKTFSSFLEDIINNFNKPIKPMSNFFRMLLSDKVPQPPDHDINGTLWYAVFENDLELFERTLKIAKKGDDYPSVITILLTRILNVELAHRSLKRLTIEGKDILSTIIRTLLLEGINPFFKTNFTKTIIQ